MWVFVAVRAEGDSFFLFSTNFFFFFPCANSFFLFLFSCLFQQL